MKAKARVVTVAIVNMSVFVANFAKVNGSLRLVYVGKYSSNGNITVVTLAPCVFQQLNEKILFVVALQGVKINKPHGHLYRCLCQSTLE